MHQLGGQTTQSEGLAAAGHRADTEAPPFIAEDLLLCRAQVLISDHVTNALCLILEPKAGKKCSSPRG